MMLSKVEARKKSGEDSVNRKLLNEIEVISKALYLDKNPPRTSLSALNTWSKPGGKTRLPEPKSKPKNSNEDPSRKDNKSIWNWKLLKAFSNVRNRRFDCCFSLHVHSIEDLPVCFNGLSLCVLWKRRDGGLMTRPAKVFDGTAEFEEKMAHTCSIYGSKSGPHHSAKYEAKHFLLYASLFGTPDLDLGKHRLDLTRLLPLTLQELEEEKSSGKWTTSFKLSGKAKGATMNVSFGYVIIGDNRVPLGEKQVKQNMGKEVARFGHSDQQGRMRRFESLPSLVDLKSFGSSHLVEEIKDLHEVLPVSKSELDDTRRLDQKFDDVKSDVQFEPIKPPSYFGSETSKEDIEKGTEDNDFSVVEKGIELSSEEQAISTAESSQVVETKPGTGEDHEECSHFHASDEASSSNQSDVLVVQDCNSEEVDQGSKESLMRELELALDGVTNLETALDSPDPEDPEDYMENKANYKTSRKAKSLDLDEVTESVAIARERLLRQFEEDALASGFSLLDFDMAKGEDFDTSTSCWGNLTDDLSLAIQDVEQEHQMANNQSNKTRAKMLEDLETEALMREWGLNDKTFQHSPPDSSGGFGSPVHFPPEEPLEFPPLGEELGPFLQTKNGGFLRSMNPLLFNNAKNGGNLIMQVSNPVVVPAETGSGIMDILQQLASVGIEKLSMQANKLMPLEDLTGKTMEQVAWETAPTLEGPERQCLLQNGFEVGQDMSSGQKKVKRGSTLLSSNKRSSTSVNEMGSDYVSLEDLAPLAMDKIEALSMEGLRIQSGMSDEDAPANISAQSIGEISTLQGKGFDVSGSLGLDGTGGLQLLDIENNGDDVDGLMSLSLTLDEWMRLDSGDIYDEGQISERTSKVLAAHHATSLDLICRGSKGEKRRGRKCGLLGNNFTVALMVQLHDPIRNYEPVGAPMLALIQVERVFVPPKPKIYRTVSASRNNNQENDESTMNKEVKEDEIKEESASQEFEIPQFRITEVHVAGLKTEPGKMKLWGTKTQQQSGSRWLLANGMGKSNKHPLLKSKAPSKSSTPSTTNVQPGDTLWSISSRIHGTRAKWKEQAALNPHIRNPNIIFPNETIRLK
ncbi:myosin-Vb-like [Hibiscus syriacus]|uniref:Myosin-Vb-like n=1 Tax=Hibiscus syriacus TaxID=106335 RepID=A0A6A3BUK9_HIBSY|nr:myosin-Vb-like [Hibiscus syriacus]